ncbi:MAG: hypothetical protein Aurels2KO_53920 [Aureliella sp.]
MFQVKDPFDPNALAFKQYKRKLRNAFIVFLAVGCIVVWVGIPCIYGEHVPKNRLGRPLNNKHLEKTELQYYCPFLGRKPIPLREVPDHPTFAFLPLRYFVNLQPYKNPVSQFILSEEFFDGPENPSRSSRH